ncbi:hypothetical protein [Desulfonatronospira sp.]|uniref:hypothetical protein n=1 Tax=Desulfonatronospira sp. TaxID=1962951 RepID=UPI0025C5A874|nr:hypothetical protein [Desulfonatronospira sp.]
MLMEIPALAVIMFVNYPAFFEKQFIASGYAGTGPLSLHFALDAMCKLKSGRWIKIDFQT